MFLRPFSRLAVTLSLIRFSLFPAVTPGSSLIPHLPDSCRTVSPELLYSCFDCGGDGAGEFSLFVPEVFPLGAIFVLFRLKRWGFSGCCVSAGRDGLFIRGQR